MTPLDGGVQQERALAALRAAVEADAARKKPPPPEPTVCGLCRAVFCVPPAEIRGWVGRHPLNCDRAGVWDWRAKAWVVPRCPFMGDER